MAAIIRTARSTDADAIRRIGDRPVDHSTVRGHRLVAEVRGVVAATVTLVPAAARGDEWPKGSAEIRALTVDSAYCEGGLARELVDACVDRATNAGADAICVHTADFMPAAGRLYERAGFVRAPECDRPVEGNVTVAYRMDLRPRRNVRRLPARRVIAPARAALAEARVRS